MIAKQKAKKKKLTKEQREAQEIVKNLEGKGGSLPPEEKNILDWGQLELKAYVLTQTAGLSTKKKLKFAHDLMKRIEEEKRKRIKK